VLRGSWVTILAVLLVTGGCARRESEAQMRERVRREARQQQAQQARERVEARQAERRRAEAVRRERQRKLESLRVQPSHGGSGVEPAPALESPTMAAEKDRPDQKRDRLRKETRPRAGASMSARPRAPSRYHAPAPAPRRRLKRPRRRRSPSLEGLFE
jgi:hypothetical protein